MSKCAFSLTRVGHTQPPTLKSDTLAHTRISHMLTHAGNIRRLTRADKSGKLAHSGIYVILNNVPQRASVLLKQQQKHKHGMCTILKGTKFSLNLWEDHRDINDSCPAGAHTHVHSDHSLSPHGQTGPLIAQSESVTWNSSAHSVTALSALLSLDMFLHFFWIVREQTDMHVCFLRVWDKRESANNCAEHEEQTSSACGYAQTGTLTTRQPLWKAPNSCNWLWCNDNKSFFSDFCRSISNVLRVALPTMSQNLAPHSCL